jgi:hypothetical protein
VKDSSDIAKHLAMVAQQVKQNAQIIMSMGEKSTGALGRDIPEVAHSVSSSGLPRDKNSVFEPVIHNKDPWQPIVDPASRQLGKRGWKRLFSPWRDPDAREEQPMNGGPHLRKRRALEVILP